MLERIAYSKKKSLFFSCRLSATRYPLNARNGLTLIELLIAISLVGMIILAVVAVDVASRRFVNTSDYEARAQNQISPALEMIAKDVSQAIGNRVIPDPPGSGVRQNPPGNTANIGSRLDTDDEPGDYNDDTWIGYSFDSGTSIIRRKECPNNAWPCVPTNIDPAIANHIINTTDHPTSFSIDPSSGAVTIVISAQLSGSDSTPVTLETTVFPRSNSAS